MSKRWIKEGSKKVAGLMKKTGADHRKKHKDFPVLEGHPISQEHAEAAVETHESLAESIKALKKEFKIYRWSPDHPTRKPFLQSYFIDLSTCGPMVS